MRRRAFDFLAATCGQDSLHNQTPPPWTRTDQFVDSGSSRLPQSLAAVDADVRAAAGRIPDAHHGGIDPNLLEQPGGDRKVVTASFFDRDGRHSCRKSDLLFVYAERDHNDSAGVDAFAINQTNNPGARNRRSEAVHAPRIQPLYSNGFVHKPRTSLGALAPSCSSLNRQ